MSLRNAPWEWMRRQWAVGGGPKGPPPPFSFTDPTFNNGVVYAIVDDGSGGKFVGGSFTSVTCNVTSTTYTTGYERLIHLLPNGEVDAEWSCPTGGVAYSLLLDAVSGRLYVGFDSSSIGGATRRGLAAITASTGVVVPDWVCNTGSFTWVKSIAIDVSSDRLYVAGNFTSIGGATRRGLAAITASTGVVVPDWVCNLDSPGAYAILLDVASDRLYVGGDFQVAQNLPRVDLFAVTASTGVVIPEWVCNSNHTSGHNVRTFAFDAANDVLFVGGYGWSPTGIGGKNRLGIAAITASTGVVVPDWVCNTSAQSALVLAIAFDADNDVLYVGGAFNGFDGIGGFARNYLAAVTASTGAVVSEWVCNASSSVVALTLDAANDVLYVGGTFNGSTGLDGQQRGRFGTVVASTGDLFVP